MIISSKIKNGINGKVNIPGDKSISHRSIIIPSISQGFCEIKNLLKSEDVINTLNAFKLMGVKIIENSNSIIIEGKGLNSLQEPKKKINLGNSGTSARLLIGLLSSQKFNSIIIGDESLSKRPMDRITKPLELMGGKFLSHTNKLPIEILGKSLKKIDYDLKLPSAQVKSGLILAALNTIGTSKIIENNITRNHTELLLQSFGANIEIKNVNSKNYIRIDGKKELIAKNISIPSDISSASFFIIAALINNNSNIKLNNININPTRNGILIALEKMGANIIVNNLRTINEEIVGDIEVNTSELNGCTLDEDFSRLMIDEYPILAIAASFAKSPSLFKGLDELRVKESDRLNLINYNLNQCGIFSKIEKNNLFIDPSKNTNPIDNSIKTDKDHRIAMAFSVLGTKIGIDLKIMESEYINTSFPNFVKVFNSVGGNLSD